MNLPNLYETLVALGVKESDLPSPDTDRWHSIRCVNPHHADDRKSASVNFALNDGHGAYNCHGCGLRGNSINVIMTCHEVSAGDAFCWADEHVKGFVNGHARKQPKKTGSENQRYFESVLARIKELNDYYGE